jgi:ClpP class serine protease
MIMHADPAQLKNFFFFDEPPKSKVKQRGSAAIVPIQGVIGWGDTWADVVANIEEAAEMPGDRIILDINTPGGYNEGIGEIMAALEAAKKKKRVIAFVPGTAASLGYWIACGAHEIVANASAVIGCIGTVVDVYKVDNDWRITMVSSQTPYKVPDPEKPETLEHTQALLDDMTDVFIADIARNRGIDTKKVLDTFGKGACLIAHKALAVGMIDAIGNFKSVLTSPAQASENKTENKMSKSKIHSKIQKGMRAELVVVDDESADVEGEPVEEINKDWLSENMPELYEEIKGEGRQEERDRIAEIDEEAGDPMDAEEAQAIAAARKDGKMKAAAFAATFFKMRAQKLAGQKNPSLADREADAPAPLKQPANNGQTGKVTSLADRAKASGMK